MSLPNFSVDNPSFQWDRFCELLWFDKDLGFWLDISRMDISSSDLDDLEPRLKIAFERMQDIESGSVGNPDENRQVGHYWLRNSSIAPNKEISDNIESEIQSIKCFGNYINEGKIRTPKNEKYTDVFWIGIGGSSLGPLLIVEALKNIGEGLNIHFLDNVDPNGINEKLRQIDKCVHSTLFVVVSKSGGTPEPKIGMDQARYFLESKGGSWPNQSVAITMPGSDLDLQARNERWLKTFDLPSWVGGRTSITSAVGLLPASLIGIDINQFLLGASLMDKLTRNIDYKSNPSALLAIAWFKSGNGKGVRDMVILPYRDRLEVFSRYLQQLIMESLGKKLDRSGNTVNQGISVFGNKGSTDQHAYVQQLRDGIDNYFATFIEILKDTTSITSLNNRKPGDFLSGFLQGTRQALTEAGKQSVTITLKKFDSISLGALIALFERTVSIYAELININAYNQPGVEAGKKAASQILNLKDQIINLLSDGRLRTISEINNLTSGENSESIYFILRHLLENNPEYLYEGEWSSPKSLKFRKR